ncbi:hypothetical protein F5Y05DRAFT_422652 [Hypoxylon sp. FL0543]|nr:hypothetical protein F5Y05DRAFT_422652 [Hypoxylon sp. FL0543]
MWRTYLSHVGFQEDSKPTPQPRSSRITYLSHSPREPESPMHPRHKPVMVDTDESEAEAQSDSDDDTTYLGSGHAQLPNLPPIRPKRGPKLPPIRRRSALDNLARKAWRRVPRSKPPPIEPYTWTTAEMIMVKALLSWRTAIMLNRETKRMLGVR